MSDLDAPTIELNDKGLKALMKAFGASDLPSIRIGVLGNGAARENNGKSSISNAGIAAVHEYGSLARNIPARSFLRMPLTKRLGEELDAIGVFSNVSLAKIMKESSLYPLAIQIAGVAEKIVLEAFDTAGFGEWKTSNMSRKKVKQTLIESGQLKKVIDSEVK